MIRWSWIACAALLVVGCSKGNDQATHDPSKPDKLELAPGVDTGPDKEIAKPKTEFRESVFRVPVYPGSKSVPNSTIEADSDLTKSFSQSFVSTDSLEKIESFLTVEGKKLGKFKRVLAADEDPKLVRNGVVDFADGKVFQYNLVKNEKEKNVLISYAMMETKPKK
jgi:hypothetical protein